MIIPFPVHFVRMLKSPNGFRLRNEPQSKTMHEKWKERREAPSGQTYRHIDERREKEKKVEEEFCIRFPPDKINALKYLSCWVACGGPLSSQRSMEFMYIRYVIHSSFTFVVVAFFLLLLLFSFLLWTAGIASRSFRINDGMRWPSPASNSNVYKRKHIELMELNLQHVLRRFRIGHHAILIGHSYCLHSK